jgi:acyl-CoA synthetase (NDP forming)
MYYVIRANWLSRSIKIVSPDIVHKVDVGGVELNLRNSQEVRSAFQRIIRDVRNANSQARLIGIHIEEFVKAGKEVIIGMKRDPQFGPLLMFGSGGICRSV